MITDTDKTRFLLTYQPPKIKQQDIYNFGYPLGKDLKFNYSKGGEIHNIRRKAILQKYPQVQQLLKKSIFGYITYPLISLFIFFVQLILGISLKESSWLQIFLFSYFVGGTLCHTQFVLMHDLTHFAAYESITLNKLLAIFVNVATGIPSAISFGKHHADHHRYLQIQGLDPDLATQFQINLVGRSSILKLIFGVLLFVPYGIRPLIVHGKPPCTLQIVNIILCLLFDLTIFWIGGIKSLVYIIGSTLISMSIIHPSSLHILAQHYQFIPGIDTFDYIGPMNIPNLNMGYHIQHHDFPMMPWFKLPQLRKIAPQYYQYIPVHTSYIRMLFRFLFDEGIALCTRTAKKNQLIENND